MSECWKKDIERKREIAWKSTGVRVNTSTHCHPFSLLLAVISVKAWKKTDKKGFNGNKAGVKLLPDHLTQDVCVSLTAPTPFYVQLSR